MKLDDILGCFPSITDWEDSYLATGGQRLLGDAKKFQVEIILEGTLQKISLFFSDVDPEILACITLVSKDNAKSLAYLKEGAVFITSMPNTPFLKVFGDFEIEMTQIQASDAIARSLIIRPRGPVATE